MNAFDILYCVLAAMFSAVAFPTIFALLTALMSV